MEPIGTTELIEQWLYGRPEKTQKAYLSDVLSALKFMGHPDLDELGLGDLQVYQTHLFHERSLEVSTVRRKVASLRSLLRFAQEQGHIDRNPSVALRSPKDNRTIDDKILTREQVQAVIDAASYDHNHAMLRFLYASGARSSEMCDPTKGLRWGRCKQQPDGSATIRLLGKGDKWRTNVLPALVWTEVVRLRRLTDTADDRVFRLGVNRLEEVFKAAAAKAGCPQATPHWFRHSIISHLIEAGMPLPAVRDFAGHSNISTTNIYAHASPEQNPGNYLKL